MQYNEIITTLQNLTGIKPKQREIADILGIRVNVIGQRAARGSEFSIEDIKKIGEYYGVDLFNQIKTEKCMEIMNYQMNCVKVVFRPDVYLSAGYGYEVIDEHKDYMYLDERLFFTDRGTKINPAACEIVTISGNSMSPEYRHGDRVILDKSVTEFIDGHIFAFRLNGECFIKEICLLGKRAKAVPLNKDYDAFFIEPEDDLKIFGRIVPRVRL